MFLFPLPLSPFPLHLYKKDSWTRVSSLLELKSCFDLDSPKNTSSQVQPSYGCNATLVLHSIFPHVERSGFNLWSIYLSLQARLRSSSFLSRSKGPVNIFWYIFNEKYQWFLRCLGIGKLIAGRKEKNEFSIDKLYTTISTSVVKVVQFV